MNKRLLNFPNSLLKLGLVFVFGLGAYVQSSAQALTGTKTIGVDYPTLTAAISDLNTNGVGTGGVVFNVPAGYTETISATLLVTATGTLANPITFQKSGAGANPVITAYTGGTGTPGTAISDGIWALVGSDYVTIDGFDLVENAANTANPATMEYGIALFKNSATDGAQNNTIQNCRITLSRINNASWTVGHFGSIGILSNNTTRAAGSTALTVTAATGANSNNKFYTNTIDNCNAGIVLQGFAAASPFTNGDTGNDIGGTSSLTGNSVINFGGAAAAANAATGIFTQNQWSLNVSYNTVNNNNGSGVNHVNTLRGINLATATSANGTCNNNTVTLSGGATTSNVEAILVAMGSTAASNTINIRNNRVVNCTYATATSGIFSGISCSSSATTVNIQNNTIDNISYSGSALAGSGTVTGILHSGASPTVNLLDNVVKNITRTGTTGGTTVGINATSGTAQNFRRDSVYGLTIGGAGAASTMYGVQASTGTIVIDSCIVFNLSCTKATGTSNLYGIFDVSTPTNETYTNNRVYNITHSGTGLVSGLNFNTTTGTRLVNRNTVYNITGTGGTVTGITSTSSSPTITQNRIFNLQSNGVAAGSVFGISLTSLGTSGSASIAYNLIGNLTAPLISSATEAIRGISITATTATSNIRVHYNTIDINASSTGANFSATGIFHTTSTTATTARLFMRNNIIRNNSTPSGTGTVVAYRRSSTAMNNYDSTSNNNLYFAGPASVNRFLFSDGTNNVLQLGTLRTLTSNRADSISITGNLSFQSADPFSADYLKPVVTANLVESYGAVVSGFTGDFNSLTGRSAAYPLAGQTNGFGTTPDIGAYELDMSKDAVIIEPILTTQVTGIVTQGDRRRAIIGFSVHVRGNTATPVSLTNVKLSMTGTTNPGDLDSAILFYAPNRTYNPVDSNILGAPIVSPSGQLTFSMTRALPAGMHFFWLAYGISPSAVSTNFMDATLDSVELDGAYYLPTNGNPSGNIQILSPITYISSVATQPSTSRAYQNTINQVVAGIEIVMSSPGTNVPLDSIVISTNGTTLLTDITNLRVWTTGTSSTFATTTQYGTTRATPAATNTVSGTLSLVPGTNYLWVTYDIPLSAVNGNNVDAEVLTVHVNGGSQTPTTTAPAGVRPIRTGYCIPTYTIGKTDGDLISNISISGTTLANNSGTAQVNPSYTFFEGSPNLTATFIQGGAYTVTVTVGTWGTQGIAAWIDYNDDQVFSPSERIGFTAGTIGTGTGGLPIPANHTASFGIQLSCASVPGKFRMRVRDVYNQSGNAIDPCNSQSYGETEDYDVTILVNPLVYQSSTAQQVTGIASPGQNDKAILRIPVYGSGCSVGTANEFRFRYTGTNVADILNAKLYTTGNSATFNTSKLIGTVGSPLTNFSFLVTDTVIPNDTTNYWLVYDVSPTATTGNFMDAALDSFYVLDNWRVPTATNPAGNWSIQPEVTYVSSTVFHPFTHKVDKGTNKAIAGARIIMSSVGVPVPLTSVSFLTNGTTDTANISNLKIWSTGSSSVFATNTQFGSTVAFPGTGGSVTGSLLLNPDTNYIWVTYDVKNTALKGNVVDVELSDLTINGNVQTPLVTAPSGNRIIRNTFCAPSHPVCPSSSLITNVTFGSINNTTACESLNGPAFSSYNPEPAKTTSILRGASTTLSLTIGADFDAISAVWIDYNQNDTFESSEFTQIAVVQPFGTTVSVPINVPCSALTGETVMRIRTRNTGSPNGAGDACTIFFAGECEEYVINILDNPVAVNHVNAVQETGLVAPGALNRPILRIPVRSAGCGVALATTFKFNTVGTTTPADIQTAKLYKTGSSAVFNTSTLVTSISSPNGSFDFFVTDTLINNDTTNYWLAYDISPSAVLGGVVDARLDSVEAIGGYVLPVSGNPAGSVTVNAPMTYVSSTTTTPIVSRIVRNSANNPIIRLEVVTSPTGSPISMESMDINLNGTTDTADIQNIKVWYTGSSSTFAATTQFGATIVDPPVSASPFAATVPGSQALVNGSNYFWITFDVPVTAAVGNAVDAECTQLTISGANQNPTVSAPAGARLIRGEYCPSSANFAGDEEIYSFGLNGNANASDPTIVAPGPGSILNRYSNFTTLPALTTVAQGQKVTFEVIEDEPDGPTYYQFGTAIWVDFNQDGDFADAGENVLVEPTIAIGPRTITGSFYVPLGASLGETRVRVMVVENVSGTGLTPCLVYGYGETEDYLINITAAPSPVEYVWNQTAPGNFNNASNWTPSRTVMNLRDALVFNNGGNRIVNEIQQEIVRSITVASNTNVTFNTVTPATLITSDSLNLTAGTIITSANVSLELGRDTNTIGLITGPGTIEGGLARWTNPLVSSYNFPLALGAAARSATIDYTVNPSVAGKLGVRFVTGAPGTTGLPLTDGALTLENIATTGIWRLSNTNGLTGGTFNATLVADSIPFVTNFAGTSVVSRTNNSSPWTVAGTQVPTSGSNTSMTLMRNGLNAYRELGIAGDASNPLPVSLVTFVGSVRESDALLQWTTSSELNNRGFEVERSFDGVTFKSIGFVKGAGTSNRTVKYATTDRGAFANASLAYYRLKQVDFDGKYEYSSTIQLNKSVTGLQSVSLFPNPFSDKLSITFTSSTDSKYEVAVLDLQGKTVHTETFNAVEGINEMKLSSALSELHAGFYVIQITSSELTKTFKVMKK